jgi:hypothetical protein
MEVKYLLNVNEATLPNSIKKEFNKIRFEFRGGYNNTVTITPPFSDLYEFHIKGLLFENEDDEDYENIFVKLTNEKLSLFTKEYHKGFKSGYENNEYLNTDFNDNSDNKIKINRVFTEVYDKFNELKFYLPEIPKSYLQGFPNDGFLCIKLHFYELGVEVGTFIKCWDIILNNSYLFEEIFDKHYNQQPADNEDKNIKKGEKIKIIALLYYYNGQYITRDNAQSIANKYGYEAKTSGEGLYQDFTYYANNINRKASGENKIKCNNRIKDQNRVIELLSNEEAKSKAITELNLLKGKLRSLT